jgi:hypothetical protein
MRGSWPGSAAFMAPPGHRRIVKRIAIGSSADLADIFIWLKRLAHDWHRRDWEGCLGLLCRTAAALLLCRMLSLLRTQSIFIETTASMGRAGSSGNSQGKENGAKEDLEVREKHVGDVERDCGVVLLREGTLHILTAVESSACPSIQIRDK